RRHTRFSRDWSSDVCSSDLTWKQPFESRTILQRIAFCIHTWWSSPSYRARSNPSKMACIVDLGQSQSWHDSKAFWKKRTFWNTEIGRASCRERGGDAEGARS